jgi:hypothetical protein
MASAIGPVFSAADQMSWDTSPPPGHVVVLVEAGLATVSIAVMSKGFEGPVCRDCGAARATLIARTGRQSPC